MLFNFVPQFIYPTSRQYPVDEVGEQIVRELEKRNWKVPGLKAEFDVYGSGEEKYRMLRSIEGPGFLIRFGRPQGRSRSGYYNNTAALDEITINGMQLHLYDDESGPTLYVYVGKNWESDFHKFAHWGKVNSKLNHEPRMYLRYSGSSDKRGGVSYQGRRSQYLVHDTDLGREYGLMPGDKPYYETANALKNFSSALRTQVLEPIKTWPVANNVDPFAVDGLISFPEDLGFELYTYADESDARRIKLGSENDPYNRFALCGSWRLIPLGVSNDGTFPEVANDGFVWCNVGTVDTKTLNDLPDYLGGRHGHYRWSDNYVVRVKPRISNNVFITDMAGMAEFKKGVWEKNPAQERLTQEQYLEFQRIPGRKLVPITEYKGGYLEPVVLINRELDFDEVELVGRINKQS